MFLLKRLAHLPRLKDIKMSHIKPITRGRNTFTNSGMSGGPQRRAWQPTPVFLPGESHGQRSLLSMGSQSQT